MSSQLALFGTDSSVLIPERHINHEVSGIAGLQDVGLDTRSEILGGFPDP